MNAGDRRTGDRRTRLSCFLLLSLLPLAACAGSPSGGPSAERTHAPRFGNAISAYATWVKEGEALRTGAAETSYAGALLAQAYLELPGSPLLPVSQLLLFGWMACPIMVQIEDDGSRHAFGHCTIRALDQGEIFADIVCTGPRPEACDGSFRLTGGTERFRRAFGSGPLRISPASNEIILTARDGDGVPSRSCPMPDDASRAAGWLRSSTARPNPELGGLGCRLERLPFVSSESAAHPLPISIKE